MSRPALLLSSLRFAAWALPTPELPTQMNHVQYTNALDGSILKHRGEHFEVYSFPFTLRYAEALHTFEQPLPVPDDIKLRFAGRTMAVTGYETNWEALTDAGTWRAAKSTEAYVHHYQLYLFSSKAPPDVVDRNMHPNDDFLRRRSRPTGRRSEPASGPLVQTFMEGNGNENRGSFHGLPEGFAQLIDSPAYFRNLYHVINTWSPDGNASWGPGTAAPLPRASVAVPGAPYSGLIECPCSTRRGQYQETGIIAQDFPANTSGKKFKALCAPGGSLERQTNTICHPQTYKGGLQCCDEGMIMLDADQTLPASTSTFRARLRFYFEDPVTIAAPLREAFFLFAETEDWQSEYDVPQLPLPSVHILQRNFQARELFGGLLGWNFPDRFNCSRVTTAMCGGLSEVEAAGGIFELRYAHFHQHVSMIGGTLVNADTGELLCETRGVYGTGDQPLDERGYVVAIPPCVWKGTAAPRLRLNSNLTSTARYNATHRHLAVMSMWEMRGALLENATADGILV